MTVCDLLALLHDLPIDALDKQVLMSHNGETFKDFMLLPVKDRNDDPTIIGYVMVESRQMEFNFTKEIH